MLAYDDFLIHSTLIVTSAYVYNCTQCIYAIIYLLLYLYQQKQHSFNLSTLLCVTPCHHQWHNSLPQLIITYLQLHIHIAINTSTYICVCTYIHKYICTYISAHALIRLLTVFFSQFRHFARSRGSCQVFAAFTRCYCLPPPLSIARHTHTHIHSEQ